MAVGILQLARHAAGRHPVDAAPSVPADPGPLAVPAQRTAVEDELPTAA
jgi:hypothetical protein